MPTDKQQKLDYYYRIVTSVILSKQHPISGLIPASVAINSHGDYTDAWVRDNVYSIFAVFGLALAYKPVDEGRCYELQMSVVKLMRGLLQAMMKQAYKVELFKNRQSVENALHAKYSTATGDPVVGDHEWGHLQIDATSIFLLALAEMSSAGLNIIYTQDEVDFVQNLVYYVERAYRTPDYGIWERGNKTNHGTPELNSSSIGMAVAALQAINGIQLGRSRESFIHVLPDEIVRNYTTLLSSLPRESHSKEIDASLLSIVGYPAFAVHGEVRQKTFEEIVHKLEGKYGCKRFLRDGHQTVVEDTRRLHYEPSELKIFEHIECEWPLFFCYLVLNSLFCENLELVEEYRAKLKHCLVASSVKTFTQVSTDSPTPHDGPNTPVQATPTSEVSQLPDNTPLVPELYIVPKPLIEAEKKNPHSQLRQPNENIPLVWAESLYLLGEMVYDKLLTKEDLDPLGRHLEPRNTGDTIVQILLVAEDRELQNKLLSLGLETQTRDQLLPVRLSNPKALREAYTLMGMNSKLLLTGRPRRPVGTLATSKLYQTETALFAFTPHFMDKEEFYMISDNDYLVSQFEHELKFIRNHWSSAGRPLMVIELSHEMLNSKRKSLLMGFLIQLKSGVSGNGVRVRLGRMQDLRKYCCVESLDFLNRKSENFRKARLQELLSDSTALKLRDEFLSLKRQKLKKPHSKSFVDKTVVAIKEPNKIAQLLIEQASSLEDQITLLQHLLKHASLDHFLPQFEATIKDLLEEIYHKSLKLQKWNIVRHSAALLRKVVNSLTINLTDLLIRHKYLTIGYKQEITVYSPLAPDMLADIIFKHSENDMRHASLVQEILTYLGSFVRSEPMLFTGILRLRTWFIIQIIVDEIQRMRSISKSKAVDMMFKMAPYEIKRILGHILSAKDPIPTEELVLRVQSGGYYDGNFSTLMNDDLSEMCEPGFNALVLAEQDGSILEVECGASAEEVVRLYQELEDKQLLVLAVKGDAEITEELKKVLAKTEISRLRPKDSYCLICTRHNIIKESFRASKQGPTELIEYTLKFTPTSTSGSEGYWLRRRKIDGSLQRVPMDFYKKVHRILELSKGLKLHQQILPSEIVNEKTPEEISFALKIEELLNFNEPHERQICVELLMVISELVQRNPVVIGEVIDLSEIIKVSHEMFKKERQGMFGDLPPKETINYFMKGIMRVLPIELNECKVQ